MTVRLGDEARQVVFSEVEDLEAARAATAKLTGTTRRILYVEIEGQLARDQSTSATPAALGKTQLEPVTPIEPLKPLAPIPAVETDAVELSFAEAKRRAEAAFERDYLSGLMARANGKVSAAARLAGVDRPNFRRLLQRNGLRSKGVKTQPKMKTEQGAKCTERILKLLGENPQGLRTCEVAKEIAQAINYAFGILKSLRRQGRVERHGTRYDTLWTLPGVLPKPRVETIPAAAVAVLSRATAPMDGLRLRDEMRALLRGAGKPSSKASVARGIGRLLSIGTVVCAGANENGAMYALAPKEGTTDLN